MERESERKVLREGSQSSGRGYQRVFSQTLVFLLHSTAIHNNHLAMSSLRLALKQSLEESGPPKPAKKRKVGRPRGRPPKQQQQQRSPGDPPRKRGRPRKHPIVTLQKEEEGSFSSENEFSVSHESSESEVEQDDHELHKEQRKLKRKRERHSAANTIQSRWKRTKQPKEKDDDEQETPRPAAAATAAASKKSETTDETSTVKKGKAKTVPPPSPELVVWMRGLSIKKQKKHVAAGMRVKVRFATNVRKRDGKIVRRLKWYGGLVTKVSTGGSKIRIKYDDGTSEVSKFPDKDIIVDDTGNGEHLESAQRFIPPPGVLDKGERSSPVQEKQTEKKHDDEEEKELENKSVTPKPDKNLDDEDEEKASTGTDASSQVMKLSPPTPPVRSAAKAAEKAFSTMKARRRSSIESQDEGNDSHDDQSDSHDDEEPEAVEIPRKEEYRPPPSKPKLTIHLKPPKASSEHKRQQSHSSSEEEQHTDESSDDAMSVEEEASHKEEEAASKLSMANSEDTEEASQPSKGQFARRKRAYDRVGGEESTEEPRAKKRMANVKQEEDDAGTPSSTGLERQFVNDEEQDGKISEEDKAVSEPGPDPSPSEGAEQERKRKREEVEPSSSPRPSPQSPSSTTEPPSQLSADLKESTSEADLSKPVSSIATSKKTPPELEEAASEGLVLTSSKNSAFDRKDKAAGKDSSVRVVSSDIDKMEGLQSTTPLAPQEEESSADDSVSKALAPVARSGRRAAQQANERIAARQEIVIQDLYAKTKKRKEKAELKLFSSERKRKPRSEKEEEDDDELEWVQCDNCLKWRILPSNVQTDELPKHWYCEMNVHDKLRNNCDAPEQTPQEIAKEKRRRKRKLAKLARLEAAGELDAESAATQKSALKKEKKFERKKERARSPMPEKKGLQEDDKAADSTTKSRTKRASPFSSEDSAQAAESPRSDTGSDSQKSGALRKQSSFASTGRKSRSDEADDASNAEGDGGESASTKVVKVARRGPGRPRVNKEGRDKGAKGGKKDPDNQEWVMCEKCHKWRKIPPHMSADSLPEVWYCTMNTWNPRAATCDAEEDKADPNTREFGIYGSGVSTASYGNKLSYRNLIFGTGRKQNRPVSERTRAAESLFLAPVDPSSEGTSYPTVMYANSSMFMSRTGNNSKPSVPDDGTISLFSLMSHSNLWAELRGANLSLAKPDKPESIDANQSYDFLSDNAKQTMKQLVLHALGSDTLACHDVLFEAQCREWTDVPEAWSEIRASCTIDIVQGALSESVADGLVEIVQGDANNDLSQPKYRRFQQKKTSPNRATRCIKIAKPWKKARSNVTPGFCNLHV